MHFSRRTFDGNFVACSQLKDVRAKIFKHAYIDFFGKFYHCKMILERTCPEEHLNLSKSGFVSEEGHSD